MRLTLLTLLACPLIGLAAPPTVTYLNPSGGQVGSTVEVTAGAPAKVDLAVKLQ